MSAAVPSTRHTPFDLVFAPAAETVFPKVQASLTQTGQDPRDRDAFLMQRDVVTLLRELRPDEGLGEGIDQLAALVHHAYLYWQAGAATVGISLEELKELLGTPSDRVEIPPSVPVAYYAQLPEHRIWAQVMPDQPAEPLDGCFVHASSDPSILRVLGVFGLHSGRAGFSVVECAGPRPGKLLRSDSSPPFGSVLPGGAGAGLFSIIGEEELLDLGWRTAVGTVGGPPMEAVRWRA
jgi:hypothetical protein